MKHLCRALSLATLFCASLAQANHFDNNNLSLNVGPTFNYARFRFFQQDGDTITRLPGNTTGYMAGIHADLTYQACCGVFARLRFDGRWNAGNFNRNFLFGTETFFRSDRFKVRDYRPEFNIGYTFAFGDCCDFSVTPYTGVGLIQLQVNRRFPDTTGVIDPAIARDTRRRDVYVPVGVQLDWARSECFGIGLNAEYRIGVWNRFERNFFNTATTRQRIRTRRADSFLVEVPLTWQKETCHCFDWQFRVVPYFDWTRWGGLRRDEPVVTPPLTTADARLRMWYVGLHIDFGVNF
ncbi:MAG: autotransporter outer membrane beta-barrel domain-containing protein [Candidatus Babeliales bacterium]